jgi:ketosteroid isomerase-like protein
MGKDAAVVSELLRALIRRDGDAVAGMVTDDFTFEPVSTEAAARGVYRGSAGVRTYLRDVGDTWRQFDLTVAAVEEVAGHVVVTGRVYARARATSLVADDPVAFAWRVLDGRVAWGRVFTSEGAAREAVQRRDGGV